MNRNLDSWDEDELLFVTSKDIHYFFFDIFLLELSPLIFNCLKVRKKKLIGDFKPALLRTDERLAREKFVSTEWMPTLLITADPTILLQISTHGVSIY